MKVILQLPVITEKAMAKTANGCYTFRVHPQTNKATIATEISRLFKVKVDKVRIIKIQEEKKTTRNGKAVRIRGGKKAMVFLKKGEKIPGFEEKK